MGGITACVPNMKFLCLTLGQGEVCTDANANAIAGQQCTMDKARLYNALWLINQMSQKVDTGPAEALVQCSFLQFQA